MRPDSLSQTIFQEERALMSWRRIRLFIRRLRWRAGFLLIISSPCGATNYFGRVMVGSYLSSERFSNMLDTSSNDFSTISSRFFLDTSDIGSYHLEGVADIRDLNDFFGKFDAERLALTPNNRLQAYQVYLGLPPLGPGFYWKLGRFAVDPAGGVFTDGAEAGYAWSSSWRTALFGGLDAKRPDQWYTTWNPDSQAFGVYNVYEPAEPDWRSRVFLANALVGETVQSHLDQAYFYTNGVLQWDGQDLLSLLLFLDFTPRTEIQTGIIDYQQQLDDTWSTTLNLLELDSLGYLRQQDVLELLAPSPYREASVDFRQRLSEVALLDYEARYGLRVDDALVLRELSTGAILPRLINEHLQLQANLVYRRNFTTYDDLLRLELGFFSSRWEIDLNAYYGLQYQVDGNLYHPVNGDLSLSWFFSQDLFATLGLEGATDERVTIASGYVTLAYRYGSERPPLVRSNAPPFESRFPKESAL